MAEPVSPQMAPYAVQLEPGDYYWCACGLSKKQPFCDGSHKAVGMAPQKFTVEKADTYYVCGCKKTGKAPFCDGTHKKG